MGATKWWNGQGWKDDPFWQGIVITSCKNGSHVWPHWECLGIDHRKSAWRKETKGFIKRAVTSQRAWHFGFRRGSVDVAGYKLWALLWKIIPCSTKKHWACSMLHFSLQVRQLTWWKDLWTHWEDSDTTQNKSKCRSAKDVLDTELVDMGGI